MEDNEGKEIPLKAKQMVNERLSIMIKVIYSAGPDRALDNFTLSILQNLIQSVSVFNSIFGWVAKKEVSC